MRAIVTYSVMSKKLGEKYKLIHHSCCGILSSRHLLSLGENTLFSPLLALQALYTVW